MPDLHAGPGIPIGACFEFDRLRPELVGSDAGCGALVLFTRTKLRGDALERRVRAAFDGPPLELEAARAAKVAAWQHGPGGLADIGLLPDSLRDLARLTLPTTGTREAPPELPELGTIGGGNHFAELSAVTCVNDQARATELGIGSRSAAVVVHSGSRGLGAAIAARWSAQSVTGEQEHRYLADLAGAVRFAQANRVVIAWRMLRAIGSARAGKVASRFDVVHNTVVRRGDRWLHRKGCAPAGEGELTIVLGSRGTPSWVMEGTGRTETLESVAHGAGRRISRTDARSRFKTKGAKRALQRTDFGGRVVCDDAKLLYEEHPDAYKAIEPVVSALEHAAMAFRVASLHPLITVKK